jgi:hypothetical protein
MMEGVRPGDGSTPGAGLAGHDDYRALTVASAVMWQRGIVNAD